MKAYIIRIELTGSEPLVWRQVVIPAGLTFKDLHDVIQNATNFKSGVPKGLYHLYDFELPDANIVVTDNEEMMLDHKDFMANRDVYEKRLEDIPPEFQDFERRRQEGLSREFWRPGKLSVDRFLKSGKPIEYMYDFGDGWQFEIKLDRTVENYPFGYASLLDGAEDAPPEDAGGLGGFYDFLKAYRDPGHPEHRSMKAWARSQGYQKYDPVKIQKRLTAIVFYDHDPDCLK